MMNIPEFMTSFIDGMTDAQIKELDDYILECSHEDFEIEIIELLAAAKLKRGI